MMTEMIAEVRSKNGQEDISECAHALKLYCHGVAKECGWWPDDKEPDVPRMLMLCVSELSEAMEGHRKGLQDDHLPHRKMLEVELADALIRIFDMAGGLGLDIAGAMAEKMAYNTNREDHKPENRNAEGGKAY
jgi:NTP pyrophosphatase (non-canonical NTP hydrolase)